MVETIRPARLVWRAGRDGVAHASRAGAFRTLCDLFAVDERLGWPEQRRCMGCSALVDEIFPPSEGEQRAAWGNR